MGILGKDKFTLHVGELSIPEGAELIFNSALLFSFKLLATSNLSTVTIVWSFLECHIVAIIQCLAFPETLFYLYTWFLTVIPIINKNQPRKTGSCLLLLFPAHPPSCRQRSGVGGRSG